MTKPGIDQSTRESDIVEMLLAQAEPRPAPPAGDRNLIREAVHAEWRSIAARRRSGRRMLQFAVAAGVLLAVFVTFSLLRTGAIAPVEVAAIGKSHGTVYLLGERSELTVLPDIDTVVAGQTIVTGSDAGIGLDWHGGGSLRIDADSIVEFTSAESIRLRDGRVYFDSQGHDRDRALVIETPHGSVRHLGTQYMTTVDALTLVVSVREGEVTVSRGSAADRAFAGQRLEFIGDARPSVTNINAAGEQWAWVEATAPTLDFSGKSTYDFLLWVGRETGYRVVFESAEAERVAKQGKLVGSIPGLDPRGELEVRMLGEDLDYAFDESGGMLSITAVDSGS